MKQQHEINHKFFDNIDSEIKAYLLGFYIGDGSSYKRIKGNYIEHSIRIGVSEKDRYIIELYKKYLIPTFKITTTTGCKYPTVDKIYDCANQCRLAVYSKPIYEALDKLGYTDNKTYREMGLPSIDNKMMIHLIRGYFDADGTCVNNLIKRPDRKIGTRAKSVWHIPSYKVQLLEEIQAFMKSNHDVELKIYNTKRCYYLKSSNLNEMMKMYKLFYDNAEFYLRRKKASYETIMLTPNELRAIKSCEPCNA